MFLQQALFSFLISFFPIFSSSLTFIILTGFLFSISPLLSFSCLNPTITFIGYPFLFSLILLCLPLALLQTCFFFLFFPSLENFVQFLLINFIVIFPSRIY